MGTDLQTYHFEANLSGYFFLKTFIQNCLQVLKYTYFLPVFTEYQPNIICGLQWNTLYKTKRRLGKLMKDIKQGSTYNFYDNSHRWLLCFFSGGTVVTWISDQTSADRGIPSLFLNVVLSLSQKARQGGKIRPYTITWPRIGVCSYV